MGRATRYDDTAMDPVRQRILGLIAQNRSNLRMASLAIGRNAAYLHQFIHRGTPRVLAEDDREALAEQPGLQPRRDQARPAPEWGSTSTAALGRPARRSDGLQRGARDRRPRGGGPGGLERRGGADQGDVASRRSPHPP